MKRYGAMAIALLVAAGCGSSSPVAPSQTPLPTTIFFNATLSAANEVPPVTNAEANGRGTATITLNLTRDAAGAITNATTTFVYSLTNFPAGSTLTASHIHNGPVGVTANVFVGTGQTAANGYVTAADGTVGSVTYANVATTVAQAQAIIDNPAGHYFNVHTTLNGGGAVRGQLVKQ